MKASEIKNSSGTDIQGVREWGTGIEARLDAMDDEIAKLNSRTYAMNERADLLGLDVANLETTEEQCINGVFELDTRVTALESQHEADRPEDPILITHTNYTEAIEVTESMSNITVSGVTDRYAIQVKANDVVLENVEVFDCHGQSLYTDPADDIENLHIENMVCRKVGMGPNICADNTIIISLEVDQLIRRIANMDSDVLRIRGTGAVNWLFGHGTKPEDVVNSHVDGFQTFSKIENGKEIPGFDGAISNAWLEKIEQVVIGEMLGDAQTHPDIRLYDCVFTKPLDEDDSRALYPKQGTLLSGHRVIIDGFYHAVAPRYGAHAFIADSIITGERGAFPVDTVSTLQIQNTLTQNHNAYPKRDKDPTEIWDEDPLMTLTPPKNAQPWDWADCVKIGNPAAQAMWPK